MLLSRWHAALGILFSSQTFAQTSVTLPWDPTGKNNCAGSGDCGESNIGIYCLEAYQRYDNNSRYSGYTSFVSNGRNGQGDGCTAIYRCRSSSDYGDGLTGFELKEAFSIIRGSAGCGACGSHLLQNPNCSVTLNACHSCKDSGTAAAVAVPEAQIASSSFLYYGITARSPDTSLVALNAAGAVVTTTTAVNTSATVTTSIQNVTSTLITSIAPSNTTSSSITPAPVPPFQNTTSMSSSTSSSSSLGSINATIPSINMMLPFNSTPTSTTTGATVYLPLTGPLSNATSPPVGPYANSTTTTSSSLSTSNSSSTFLGNGNFLPGASPSSTPSPTTPSSSPPTISNPGEPGQPGQPGSPPSGTVGGSGGAGGAGGLGGGITSNSSTASPTTTLTTLSTTTLTVPPPGQAGQPGQPGQPGTPGSGTLGGAGGAGGAGGLPGGAATSSTPLPGAAGAGPVPGFAGPSREAFVEGGQAGLESSASVVTVTVSVCTTVTVGVVETVCV